MIFPNQNRFLYTSNLFSEHLTYRIKVKMLADNLGSDGSSLDARELAIDHRTHSSYHSETEIWYSVFN